MASSLEILSRFGELSSAWSFPLSSAPISSFLTDEKCLEEVDWIDRRENGRKKNEARSIAVSNTNRERATESSSFIYTTRSRSSVALHVLEVCLYARPRLVSCAMQTCLRAVGSARLRLPCTRRLRVDGEADRPKHRLADLRKSAGRERPRSGLHRQPEAAPGLPSRPCTYGALERRAKSSSFFFRSCLVDCTRRRSLLLLALLFSLSSSPPSGLVEFLFFLSFLPSRSLSLRPFASLSLSAAPRRVE